LPDACEGFELEARAGIALGDGVKALDVLRAAAPRVMNHAVCQRALLGLAVRLGDADAVSAAIEDLVHGGCGEDKECVANLVYAANVEAARGNVSRALLLYKRARDRAPEDDELLASAAALASRANLHAEAMQSYELLARRHPDQPRWASAVAAERAAIFAIQRR
jgi:tetratricopeptide (TPR) repeat protein